MPTPPPRWRLFLGENLRDSTINSARKIGITMHNPPLCPIHVSRSRFHVSNQQCNTWSDEVSQGGCGNLWHTGVQACCLIRKSSIIQHGRIYTCAAAHTMLQGSTDLCSPNKCAPRDADCIKLEHASRGEQRILAAATVTNGSLGWCFHIYGSIMGGRRRSSTCVGLACTH